MKLAVIRPSTSLVEEVCLQLSSRIREEHSNGDGWLPPERALAEQLGVSRPVVREATKRLEMQGMLEIRHGSGIKVVDRLHKPLNGSLALLVPHEKDRLRQLIEVRLALEPENARLAAERASAADIKTLKSIHRRFETGGDFDIQVRADMEFHCALAEASGNKISSLLMHSLSDLLESSLTHGYKRVTKHKAVADHAAVLAAVLSRDGEAAAVAMKQHIINARADLGLKQFPSRR